MATITSAPTAEFNNLDASTARVSSAGSASLTLNCTVQDSKKTFTLKLNGSIGAQGQIQALDSGSITGPGGTVQLALESRGTLQNVDLAATNLRADQILRALFSGDDWFALGDAADALDMGGGDDYVSAGGGADRIRPGPGNDIVTGGAGIDTAVYAGPRSGYTLTQPGGGVVTLVDQSGVEGTDRLSGVERLQFADRRVAIDLDGNAGVAAKVLGVVFGAAIVANPAIVGIGIALTDQGMSADQLGALAMNAAGRTRHADVVSLLWTNLFGRGPTGAELEPLVALLDGGVGVGALVAAAANLSLNLEAIDFVGLAKNGLEYVPI